MASSSESSLRSVINEVTKEKLEILEKQRLTLKTHFATVLEDYKDVKNRASLKFLKQIHETLVEAYGDNPIPQLTRDLEVFLNFIEVDDPNAAMYFGSSRLVEIWIEKLIRYIKFRIEKYEYSCLYANVMSDYMESVTEDSKSDDLGLEEEKKKAVPTTKEETIKEFSRLVLTESPDFSKEEFEEFLNKKLFNEKDALQKNILNRARERVYIFCRQFRNYNDSNGMSLEDLKLAIDGLSKENLLSWNKTKTLRELRENSAALQEVRTIINKRIKNYTTWEWPGPVFVDFRRNMAGRYRAYMEEDIITAIILHYLGAEWGILLKSVFKSIYDSSMWNHDTEGNSYSSIKGYLRQFHSGSFLSILPDSLASLTQDGAGYDDENSYRYTKNEFSPMEIKKKVLHLISNEVHLNFTLRPSAPITVVQTDVEWFGPSIIHDAILAVMKFLGVTKEWLSFFRKFLQAPMRIGSPNAPVTVRKRGCPISHTFTRLFGETILFIMDLYVNQVSGVNVYRIHDDFWFWDSDQEAVTKAWVAMQEFTKLANLKLNMEKSASVVCSKDATPGTITFGPEPLPQKEVKWGFVVLHSDGIYRISKALLEPHVKEMQECLTKANAVMTWVHCHNKYIHFFIRNFVEPSKTLQNQHVVQIIETLRSILNEIHKETNGDPVMALKRRFPELWGDKEVIDSWVHWPVQKGGLNLYNPFLDLVPLHEAYRRLEANSIRFGDGVSRFQCMVNADEREWRELLARSRERRRMRQHYYVMPVDDETITDHELFGNDYYSPDDEDEKMSVEESKKKRLKRRVDFTTWCDRTREKRSARWRNHYVDLLSNLDATPCRGGNWREWLYKDQLEAKLGNEDGFVDSNLVPLSLISSMQAASVHKN